MLKERTIWESGEQCGESALIALAGELKGRVDLSVVVYCVISVLEKLEGGSRGLISYRAHLRALGTTLHLRPETQHLCPTSTRARASVHHHIHLAFI